MELEELLSNASKINRDAFREKIRKWNKINKKVSIEEGPMNISPIEKVLLDNIKGDGLGLDEDIELSSYTTEDGEYSYYYVDQFIDPNFFVGKTITVEYNGATQDYTITGNDIEYYEDYDEYYICNGIIVIRKYSDGSAYTRLDTYYGYNYSYDFIEDGILKYNSKIDEKYLPSTSSKETKHLYIKNNVDIFNDIFYSSNQTSITNVLPTIHNKTTNLFAYPNSCYSALDYGIETHDMVKISDGKYISLYKSNNELYLDTVSIGDESTFSSELFATVDSTKVSLLALSYSSDGDCLWGCGFGQYVIRIKNISTNKEVEYIQLFDKDRYMYHIDSASDTFAVFGGTGTYWSHYNGGVWIYKDGNLTGGEAWKVNSVSIANNNVITMIQAYSDIFSPTVGNYSMACFFTNDLGTTWKTIGSTGSLYQKYNDFFYDSNLQCLIGLDYRRGYVLYSLDFGENWTEEYSLTTFCTHTLLSTSTNKSIYAFSNGSAYSSKHCVIYEINKVESDGVTKLKFNELSYKSSHGFDKIVDLKIDSDNNYYLYGYMYTGGYNKIFVDNIGSLDDLISYNEEVQNIMDKFNIVNNDEDNYYACFGSSSNLFALVNVIIDDEHYEIDLIQMFDNINLYNRQVFDFFVTDNVNEEIDLYTAINGGKSYIYDANYYTDVNYVKRITSNIPDPDTSDDTTDNATDDPVADNAVDE